jgi:glutathione S-transferase
MKLIGMLGSPYVRRVAITMQFLQIPYKHSELSIFQSYEEFRKINPLVKIPTLQFDDGGILVDSNLIIDHLESISTGPSLIPQDPGQQRNALQIIGVALVAMEKTVQLIYEFKQRPPEAQHQPWIDRVQEQLTSACELLEQSASNANPWLMNDSMTQADVTLAVAWRFIQQVFPERVNQSDYPALVRFSTQAELQAEFIACPLS